jgi:hypothetical protein
MERSLGVTCHSSCSRSRLGEHEDVLGRPSHESLVLERLAVDMKRNSPGGIPLGMLL